MRGLIYGKRKYLLRMAFCQLDENSVEKKFLKMSRVALPRVFTRTRIDSIISLRMKLNLISRFTCSITQLTQKSSQQSALK